MAVTQEYKEKNKASRAVIVLIFLFCFLWFIAGIAAFVWSIACFGYSGTMLEKIVGLLISIFFGPFWFIYKFAVKSYCK